MEGLTLRELPSLCSWAERLGYTDAWSYEKDGVDCFTPLAAAALATRTLRLGTGIAPAFTRPAALLAMHAAAMSELAPGRFVLGIGASTPTIVSDWMGIPFARPLARTRETANTVRRLMAGERVGAMRLDRPPQQRPPVYLAALGPAMLRMAGEVADGVIFFLAGPGVIPNLLADVGQPIDSVAHILVVVGEDQAARVTHARRAIARYAIVPPYARFFRRQGFADEVEAINGSWSGRRRGSPARQVSDAMVEELSLVGDTEACHERLQYYRRQGLRTPVLWLTSPVTDSKRRRQLFRTVLGALAMAGSPA